MRAMPESGVACYSMGGVWFQLANRPIMQAYAIRGLDNQAFIMHKYDLVDAQNILSNLMQIFPNTEFPPLKTGEK